MVVDRYGPMSADPSGEVSRILHAAAEGSPVDHSALLPLVYAPVRFCLDFLRATDKG